MNPTAKKVLVLDNDENVLITLEHLLEDEGIETATTWSPRHALELITSQAFDLLVAGDHFPDLSCEELLREVQRVGPAVSVLMMCSRRSDPTDWERFGVRATVGSHEFAALLRWVKEFNSDQVSKKVRAA